MRKTNFITPMVVLTICAITETAIVYAYSVDRGWWPIVFAVVLLFYAGYCALFGLVAGDRTLPVAYTLVINAVLATTHILATYLFYVLIIDLGAVNQGTTLLTPLQSFIYSGRNFYLTLVLFLAVHFLVVKTGWVGVDRPASGFIR